MARVEEPSGVAKAGLTTGIIGTSLAGLMALGGGNSGFGNGGLLGGLFGGNNGAVNAYISGLQSQVAQQSSEKYADGVGTAVYSQLNTNMKENYQELIQTRERIVRAEVQEECNRREMDRMSRGLEEVQREISAMRVREQATTDAINCLTKTTSDRFEAVYQTIGCCKNDLMSYVNATFVPGKLVMPRENICPEVMQRYNSWVAPTTAAATSA